MNTPICDFVQEYARANALRLHMPGHKGMGPLGVEALDITEVDGADSLYEASGIIRESENNASRLFGSDTFYSTEGSSLCIRAMLYLALLHARRNGRPAKVLAGRNVHKTFLSAAALLDLDVDWLYSEEMDSYLSCSISARSLDAQLSSMQHKPAAVYVTCPDYLGNMVDIGDLSKVCRQYDVLLLVDNAHGAYLKFLPQSLHPIDLGADICCDSAHKTLPVLTGGAYLHISPNAPQFMRHRAKEALALFGSTSPSYLILQSLDAANAYLADGYKAHLEGCCADVRACRADLTAHGFTFLSDEPLKLTISAKSWGYTGREMADLLAGKHIICEFLDPDYVVLMITPETGKDGILQLKNAMMQIPQRAPIPESPPVFHAAERKLSVREAVMRESELIPVASAEGRILAAATVGCPPAVPIVVCGEFIDKHAVACFNYYGIESCRVIKE